ncbi:hypothetical protein CWI79_09130 [Pseudidiomarina salinarum]|nr:hypothetical protein CWI79_09130 [Pseudidiomarina salinarum]
MIFDLDGTLANVEHRRPILEQDSKNWREFFAAMGEDIINKPILELYIMVSSSSTHRSIILTGRPEKYRKLTEQWLVWNGVSFDELIMRKRSDYRADHVIKEEALDELLSAGNEIAFVVDDRQSVVDMWRRRGITCLQFEQPKIDPTGS